MGLHDRGSVAIHVCDVVLQVQSCVSDVVDLIV